MKLHCSTSNQIYRNCGKKLLTASSNKPVTELPAVPKHTGTVVTIARDQNFKNINKSRSAL